MHPVRRQRLFFILFIVFFSSVAVGLMAFALRDNINLFYPPSMIVAGEVPIDRRIRAGGCVRPGSISRNQETLETTFLLTDGIVDFRVFYTGILPDLFTEGEAAVVNGELRADGKFYATQVLAKHDEKYMPPEVAETMAAVSDGHDESCEVVQYGS
jgi:cytochrome c-type biogenesis protein CcmE